MFSANANIFESFITNFKSVASILKVDSELIEVPETCVISDLAPDTEYVGKLSSSRPEYGLCKFSSIKNGLKHISKL